MNKPDSQVLRFVSTIGYDTTLALVEHYGGTRIYVPRKGRSVWVELVKRLGEDGASKLTQHYAGEHLDVPLARNWRIRVYAMRGMTDAGIARVLGLTTNGVARSLRDKGSAEERARILAIRREKRDVHHPAEASEGVA